MSIIAHTYQPIIYVVSLVYFLLFTKIKYINNNDHKSHCKYWKVRKQNNIKIIKINMQSIVYNNYRFYNEL